MAKKAKKSQGDYILLRKAFAGLMLGCFIVFVLGQSAIGVSAESTLIWASFLILAIGVAGQVVINLWRSWEEVNEGAMGQKKKK